MTDIIIITMPCTDCGHHFSAVFDPHAGVWKPVNAFDDPDASCLCLRHEIDQFDIDDIDVSYTRVADAAQRRSRQVQETLADTMRMSVARSVPPGQMRLEQAS